MRRGNLANELITNFFKKIIPFFINTFNQFNFIYS